MATNGMEDDGPPLTELESLQLRANATTDDSLESTRRMIALCEDVSQTNTSWIDHTNLSLNNIFINSLVSWSRTYLLRVVNMLTVHNSFFGQKDQFY